MRLAASLVAVFVLLAAGACGDSSPRTGKRMPGPGRERAMGPADRLSLRQQVGQLLVLSFRGERAPPYVERILRARAAAGVILFAGNVASPRQLRALTRSLQRAGGDSVLVSTDQEGGPIRIIRFAGPQVGQAEQTTRTDARAAARGAARELRRLGVNVNLAPVADVPTPGSGVGGRTFPGPSSAVAAAVAAAVRGGLAGGVGATLKHFPGLGAAGANTDDRPVTIVRAASALRSRDLMPFRAGIDAGAPLVMAGHALYPTLDPGRIASQSPVVLQRVLRHELGFRGVAITDSMEARAVIRRAPVDESALRSVQAGADLVLMTGPGSYRLVFPRLLREARHSPAFRRRVREAAGRVLELKHRLSLRGP